MNCKDLTNCHPNDDDDNRKRWKIIQNFNKAVTLRRVQLNILQSERFDSKHATWHPTQPKSSWRGSIYAKFGGKFFKYWDNYEKTKISTRRKILCNTKSIGVKSGWWRGAGGGEGRREFQKPNCFLLKPHFKILNQILKFSAGYHRPEQGGKGRLDGITLRDRKQKNARFESGSSFVNVWRIFKLKRWRGEDGGIVSRFRNPQS